MDAKDLLIAKQEALIKAIDLQLTNYKEIVRLQTLMIADYEERMKKIGELMPVLIM